MDRATQLYRMMARIRAFENAAEEASRGSVAAFGASLAQSNIRGPLHLSTGQEAVAAGVCIHLTPDDLLTSTHRGHGHTLAKGAAMEPMMAELFGRASGPNKGKGGSMHIADFSVGMLGANGVVAAGIPIAVGAAEELAHRALHRGALRERVAVAAVRRGDEVIAREVRANAGGYCFLPRGEVQRPAHLRFGDAGAERGHAALRRFLGGVLEGADARHRAVQRRYALSGGGILTCAFQGGASLPNGRCAEEMPLTVCDAESVAQGRSGRGGRCYGLHSRPRWFESNLRLQTLPPELFRRLAPGPPRTLCSTISVILPGAWTP